MRGEMWDASKKSSLRRTGWGGSTEEGNQVDFLKN